MKRQTWFCLIVYLTLHTASVVRSEYTWNGSEWVWTESAVDQPPYNEVDKEDKGIYIDPPVQYPIPTTTSEVPQPKSPNQNNGPKSTNRSTSFFAQPGTLAAVIGGAVVGLLCAILCVMFVVYRMRKKDEGSYALDEPKRSPTVNAYAKHPSREFYA